MGFNPTKVLTLVKEAPIFWVVFLMAVEVDEPQLMEVGLVTEVAVELLLL
jgi:hypothetical protein